MSKVYITDKVLLKILQQNGEERYEYLSENIPTTENCIYKDFTKPTKKKSKVHDYSDIVKDDDKTLYIAKSGFEWSSNPPSCGDVSGVEYGPYLKNGGEEVRSIKEAFNLFITEKMIQEIVNETNKFCKRLLTVHENITYDEMETFIGVLLAAGTGYNNLNQFRNAWKTSSYNMMQNFYITAMNMDRFFLIYGNIRFDDQTTRDSREAESESGCEAIKTIFDQFAANCLKYYAPGSAISLESRMMDFKEKCPFRVQENKWSKAGMRIWLAIDTAKFYVINLKLDTGNVEDESRESVTGDVASELLASVYGTGRVITTHRNITSIQLADRLWQNNLTTIGELGKLNKDDIPKNFAYTHQPMHRSNFIYTERMTLVSYVVQQKKTIECLTTEFHKPVLVDDFTFMPKTIQFYLKKKTAIEEGNRIRKVSPCFKTTEKWPFRVFMELLDIAVMNSFIVWLLIRPSAYVKNQDGFKDFTLDLAQELLMHRAKLNIPISPNTPSTSNKRLPDFSTIRKRVRINLSGDSYPLSDETNTSAGMYFNYSSSTNADVANTSSYECKRMSFDWSSPSTSQSSEVNQVEFSSPSKDQSFARPIRSDFASSVIYHGKCEYCPPGQSKISRVICDACKKMVCIFHLHESKKAYCKNCKS